MSNEAGKYYFMKGFVGGGPKRIFCTFLCKRKPTKKGDFSRYCLFFLALAVVSKLRRGGRRKREYKWKCRQRVFCLKPTFNLFQKGTDENEFWGSPHVHFPHLSLFQIKETFILVYIREIGSISCHFVILAFPLFINRFCCGSYRDHSGKKTIWHFQSYS